MLRRPSPSTCSRPVVSLETAKWEWATKWEATGGPSLRPANKVFWLWAVCRSVSMFRSEMR
jgi:hypothetical protein